MMIYGFLLDGIDDFDGTAVFTVDNGVVEEVEGLLHVFTDFDSVTCFTRFVSSFPPSVSTHLLTPKTSPN